MAIVSKRKHPMFNILYFLCCKDEIYHLLSDILYERQLVKCKIYVDQPPSYLLLFTRTKFWPDLN